MDNEVPEKLYDTYFGNAIFGSLKESHNNTRTNTP
jgi:hypothetical protein